MANIVFNIAKGRVIELYNRVKSNDPANSALILVPIETSGLESDATLIDVDTLSALLAGTTNEQTTMGRKTLTDADLASLPAPNDTSDYYEVSLPTVTWTAATGNAISKIAVCYDNDTTAGTDANIIPLTMFDFIQTPSGADIQMTTGVFFRAS
ncbi:hypothetical protein [Chloroflexus sp.]|uniref:hypothetical protein n=1 Tax=Chloroflexus sp. TaxID=1904827 RepID=UPI002ACDEBE6|nr:hypothetical protein [Chloroflexus sp.]